MNKKYTGYFTYKKPSEGEYNYIASFEATANSFIYFDGVELNPSSILALSQSGTLFGNSFKLGSTVCRQVNLTVLKSEITEHPQVVIIKDIYGNTRFTLQVDSVDDTNIDFYDYVLVDKMVNLNQSYDFSGLETITAETVLEELCTELLNCEAPTINYGGDIQMVYSSDFSARDVVSWIAEINGSFARIDEEGNLVFIPFSNASPFEIDVNTCADFKLGEYHKIDRVYVELASASYGYPQSSSFNTLYLNSDNQLLSDNGEYTIQSIVEHIHSVINGYEFYSISTSRCEINQFGLPGDPIAFTFNGESYPAITQIDWSFNMNWFGGYVLEIDTKIQEETNFINSTENKINSLRIIVDRQLGTIEQSISEISESVAINSTTIQQTANDLTVRVAAAESNISSNNGRITTLESSVKITSSGVEVSNGTAGSYTNFTASGMDIYVENTKTAWASSEGFASEELMIGGANDNEKWHMHMANDGYTLMFLRR